MAPKMKVAPKAKAKMVGTKAAPTTKAKMVGTKAAPMVKAKAKGSKVKKEPATNDGGQTKDGGQMTAAQRNILAVARGDHQKSDSVNVPYVM